MSLEQLETKVKTLENQQAKTYDLWGGVDKKLDILINSNEFENKASVEFRERADKKIEKLESKIEKQDEKVVALEKTALLSGQILEQFALIRDTIVKKVLVIVVAGVFSVGTATVAYAMYMSK